MADDDPLPLHSQNWMPYADAFYPLYQHFGGDIELVDAALKRVRKKWVRRVGFPPRFEHRLLPADADIKVSISMQQVGTQMKLDDNWRDEIEFELDDALGELFVWKPDFEAPPPASPEPAAAEPPAKAARVQLLGNDPAAADPDTPSPAIDVQQQQKTKKRKKRKKRWKGAPRDYDYDAVCQVAETYIKDIGLPRSCKALMETLELRLGNSAPKTTLMKQLVGPIFKREDAKREKAVRLAAETIKESGLPHSKDVFTEKVRAVVKAQGWFVPAGPWLKTRVSPTFNRSAKHKKAKRGAGKLKSAKKVANGRADSSSQCISE
jgi:hypothetical protein